MSIQEMRKIHATGEWVVYYYYHRWSKVNNPNWYKVTMKGVFKLVHKRHEGIADAVLANPYTQVEYKINKNSNLTVINASFFESYDAEYIYQLTKPQFKIGDWVKDVSPENSGIHQITNAEQLEQVCRDSGYIKCDGPFTVTEVETDVDPKVIAEYVGKDPESMRQLKRKWESTATGLWIHYVHSYKYSLGGQNGSV